MTLRILLAGERPKDQETEDGKEDVAYDYDKFLSCRTFLNTKKGKSDSNPIVQYEVHLQMEAFSQFHECFRVQRHRVSNPM